MADSTDIINILSKIADNDLLIDSLVNSPLAKEITAGLKGIEKSSEISNKDISSLISATKIATKQQDVSSNELLKVLTKTSSDLKDYINAGKELKGDQLLAAIVQQLRELQNSVNKNGDPIINTVNSQMFQNFKQAIPSIAKQTSTKDSDKDSSSIGEKLKGFWGDIKKGSKKFISDFVKELEDSRLVKGSFLDLIKLISYLGASWLRQFGTLGKVLGVGLIAAGPVLAGLLGKVIVSGFKSVVGWLWDRIAKGLLQKAGAGISNWMWNSKSPLAQGMLNVSTMSTGAKFATATQGVAAVGLGVNAVNAWKEGHKGEAIASGIGATGFGISALAPLLPFLAPIAPIALWVGGIAGAITLIIKYHKQILDFLKKTWDFIFAPIKNAIDWVKEKWPWGGDDSSPTNTVTGGQTIGAIERFSNVINGIQGKTDQKLAKTYGKLKVAQDGSIMNAGSLSQADVKAGLEQYRKEDPERFNRVFEVGGKGIADINSFKTDAIIDGGALLYKGATSDLMKLREALIAGGMPKEKADALMFSSGMATGSNKSHTKGGWKTHSNPYALAADFVGRGWSQQDWIMAAPILKKTAKGLGFDFNYETYINGKRKFGVNPSDFYGTGTHGDMKLLKEVRPSGAVKNLEEIQKNYTKVTPPKKEEEDTLVLFEGVPVSKKTLEKQNINTSNLQEVKSVDKKNNEKIKASLDYTPDYTGNRSSSFLLRTGIGILNMGTEALV